MENGTSQMRINTGWPINVGYMYNPGGALFQHTSLIKSTLEHPFDASNGVLVAPVVLVSIGSNTENIGRVYWPFNSSNSDSIY